MIAVGKKNRVKYWGKFTVDKIVELNNPVRCFSAEKGEVYFRPTIIKISWDVNPSDDKHDLWFPYWQIVEGKEKYGQFAPMIGQKAFLELLSKAIESDYFDRDFLGQLKRKISDYCSKSEADRETGKVSEYIGGLGNTNLWSFISYFEKRLEEEIALYREWTWSSPYYQCPNFAAWIRLNTELICNEAILALNRAEKFKYKINEYRYGRTVNKIIQLIKERGAKTAAENLRINIRAKAIKLVIELRHTLQHGGIPNILREIEFKEVDENEIKRMINPLNYLETKQIFRDANYLIRMLPQPSISVYANGRVKFKEPKKTASR